MDKMGVEKSTRRRTQRQQISSSQLQRAFARCERERKRTKELQFSAKRAREIWRWIALHWIRIKLWPNWDCVWTNLLGGNWWDVQNSKENKEEPIKANESKNDGRNTLRMWRGDFLFRYPVAHICYLFQYQFCTHTFRHYSSFRFICFFLFFIFFMCSSLMFHF